MSERDETPFIVGAWDDGIAPWGSIPIVNGFIANTDLDWHGRLQRLSEAGLLAGEVNFWRPSPRVTFKSLQPGEPVFFRLKSPIHAIGGFAFFQGFSVLPVWLAWETFGLANGVASLREFEGRLASIRARNRMVQHHVVDVGCILLVDPVFVGEREWVGMPEDWSLRTVTGKRYDLGVGEGARVWRECLDRVSLRGAVLAADGSHSGGRFGAPQVVRPRLGQGGFRVAVMDAYGRACAVTTEHSLPALDAAHIQPFAEAGTHEVSNGLLLRSDIHRLFDRGYVTVTPDLKFRVSPRLRRDYANGKTYYALEGRPIGTPKDPSRWPSPSALSWHSETRFLR